jgi:hypothetical protein
MHKLILFFQWKGQKDSQTGSNKKNLEQNKKTKEKIAGNSFGS